MKAAVFRGKKQIIVEERNIPTASCNELLIKVKANGICGTDQHIFYGLPGSAEVIPPIVLGHELAGEVVQLGENVTDFQVGDRVSIDPNIYCGSCKFCREGRAHLCDNLQAIGVTRDGGMAEYCIVPADNCYHIPDSLSFEEGSLIEPLGCALHGINQISIKPGTNVLIIGGGFIGQMMLQLVRMQGAFPIAVSEPDTAKHDVLYKLGANFVVNPLTEDLESLLKQNVDAIDIVIECVGRQETMELAVEIANKGGQILLFGVSSPDTRIAVSPFDIFAKELIIKGSFINPYTHKEAISLVEQGIVQVTSLISHRFSLDSIPEIMLRYPEMNINKGIIFYE